MAKIWGGCNPCLNSFHHTDSLLFQFILSEFLQTLDAVVQIEKASLHSPDFSLLAGWLGTLSGSCPGAARSFPWSQEDGRLIKLKSYIDYLVEEWDGKQEVKTAKKLQKLVHHTWFAALEASDCVRNETFDHLLKMLDKLQSSSQRIKKGVAKMLPYFAGDENVVFFMIRHHARFSGIYGSDFVFKTLQKMYPGGIAEAKSFLQTAFMRRNFHEVLPALNSYFNSHEKVSL